MYLRLGLHVQIWLYYVFQSENFGPARDRFYIGSMYCVLRTNHAKFAIETSANFRNILYYTFVLEERGVGGGGGGTREGDNFSFQAFIFDVEYSLLKGFWL